MWIRSQDNEVLIDCKCFQIKNSKSSLLWDIYGYLFEKTYFLIGRYKDYDRSIEVLTEIETKIVLNNIFHQMPEK